MTATLAAFGCVAGFAALAWAVATRSSALDRFDERIMEALRRRRTEQLDGVVGPLSMLATQEPLTLQSLIAFLLITVTIGGMACLHFVVVAVGSGILSEVTKRAIARSRPAGPHLIRWIRGSSYPSGDLLTASAIYETTALIASPHLPDDAARAVLFAIVAAVLAMLAVCRVYAGVHHPSDVVGGACLGTAWALFVYARLG